MHILARESCCTCHFPHLLCQRWSILIMKNTHCQYRWEPAGQRSGNKVNGHSMGNRNYAANPFWNFCLGFKCSSKYWSCLSHIGKLKTYRCPRFVDGGSIPQHLSSGVLSPSVSIWSVIVLQLTLPSPIRFPWHARPQSSAAHSRSQERIGALGVSLLVCFLLKSKKWVRDGVPLDIYSSHALNFKAC